MECCYDVQLGQCAEQNGGNYGGFGLSRQKVITGVTFKDPELKPPQPDPDRRMTKPSNTNFDNNFLPETESPDHQ